MANTSEKHLFLGVKQVTKEQFDTFSDTVKKQYVWFVKDTDNVGETTYGVYFGNRRFANDGFTEAEIVELLSEKQDVLTAGEGIDIDSANTISALYQSSDFDISGLSDSQNLRETWSGKQDALNAGTGIIIDSNNVISVNESEIAEIDDTVTETGKTWSSFKISSELDTKSNTGHTHVVGDVSGLTEELDSKADKVPPTPLCFTAQQDNSSIGITNNGGNTPNIEISTDGTTWETWDYSTIPLSSGQSVYMRGMNQSGFSTSYSKYSKFTMSGLVAASGNIMSLIDYTQEIYTIPNAYCFLFLFEGCRSLTTAPELPADTLGSYCYEGMFFNCGSLTTAPELPATTLVDGCYEYMFGGCTSLTTAPELPATTLANSCYSSMFNGCNNLNWIKCLATDISAANCTYNWVSGVANSGTFVKDSTATGWTLDSNSGIPSGWTVVDHYDDVALYNKLATKVESTTIKTIWSGTQQEYDVLQTYSNDTLYIIR